MWNISLFILLPSLVPRHSFGMRLKATKPHIMILYCISYIYIIATVIYSNSGQGRIRFGSFCRKCTGERYRSLCQTTVEHHVHSANMKRKKWPHPSTQSISGLNQQKGCRRSALRFIIASFFPIQELHQCKTKLLIFDLCFQRRTITFHLKNTQRNRSSADLMVINFAERVVIKDVSLMANI